MNTEGSGDLSARAAAHAALGDQARLQIVDSLHHGDASPSELSDQLGIASNLLAHHLKALESAGVIGRHRSEGDARRTYVSLVPATLDLLAAPTRTAPPRVVFVCTANSARSHLAAALWRRTSGVPTASAGTHPADRIAPGAIETARRHHLPLPRRRPRSLAEADVSDGDLIITVCDRAHEELADRADLHWSVPDPVPLGDPAAFDAAYDELDHRITHLADRFASA